MGSGSERADGTSRTGPGRGRPKDVQCPDQTKPSEAGRRHWRPRSFRIVIYPPYPPNRPFCVAIPVSGSGSPAFAGVRLLCDRAVVGPRRVQSGSRSICGLHVPVAVCGRARVGVRPVSAGADERGLSGGRVGRGGRMGVHGRHGSVWVEVAWVKEVSRVPGSNPVRPNRTEGDGKVGMGREEGRGRGVAGGEVSECDDPCGVWGTVGTWGRSRS